jgi:hypothetical protein
LAKNETAVEIVRGMNEANAARQCAAIKSDISFGNHPSRHRKERDDAALLTQEGNSTVLIFGAQE